MLHAAGDIDLINDRHAEVHRGLSPGEEVVLFPSEAIDYGTKLTSR